MKKQPMHGHRLSEFSTSLVESEKTSSADVATVVEDTHWDGHTAWQHSNQLRLHHFRRPQVDAIIGEVFFVTSISVLLWWQFE